MYLFLALISFLVFDQFSHELEGAVLHKHSPMIRGMLAHRAKVRYAPELVFHRESAESAYHEVTRYTVPSSSKNGAILTTASFS